LFQGVAAQKNRAAAPRHAEQGAPRAGEGGAKNPDFGEILRFAQDDGILQDVL